MFVSIENLSVQPVTAPGLDYATQCFLLKDGQTTGVTLYGDVLGAQFRLDENYLVLTDTLYTVENSVHVYYLSSQFEVLDELVLGSPYIGGTLRDVFIAGGRVLHFSFFDSEDDRWQLKVLSDSEYKADFHRNETGMANKLNKYIFRFKPYEKPRYLHLQPL